MGCGVSNGCRAVGGFPAQANVPWKVRRSHRDEQCRFRASSLIAWQQTDLVQTYTASEQSRQATDGPRWHSPLFEDFEDKRTVTCDSRTAKVTLSHLQVRMPSTGAICTEYATICRNLSIRLFLCDYGECTVLYYTRQAI